MKYILLLILTFPIFAQSIENSKSASTDNTDNSTKTIEPDKEASTEPKDNTSLTQAEIRKKRKLEIGIGYGEGNYNFSQTTRDFLNINLEYNLSSRFSIGYSHLHKQKFSTSPYINPLITTFTFGITEKTYSLEVGLFNFRYYFFEKIPLYVTGGLGRDFVSRYKRTVYQYGYINQDSSIQNSPLIRELEIQPSNYRFYGLGFQWVFQNGFFIGIEMLKLQSQYTYKGNSLILDKNYSTLDIMDAIIVEKMILNPTFKENLNSNVLNIRLGYSLQF